MDNRRQEKTEFPQPRFKNNKAQRSSADLNSWAALFQQELIKLIIWDKQLELWSVVKIYGYVQQLVP